MRQWGRRFDPETKGLFQLVSGHFAFPFKHASPTGSTNRIPLIIYAAKSAPKAAAATAGAAAPASPGRAVGMAQAEEDAATAEDAEDAIALALLWAADVALRA